MRIFPCFVVMGGRGRGCGCLGGLVGLLVVGAVLAWLLFGGFGLAMPRVVTLPPVAPGEEGVPGGQGPAWPGDEQPGTGSAGGAQTAGLGRARVTRGVDANGCPLAPQFTFRPGEPIYVALEPSRLASGTRIEALLSDEGGVVQEADPFEAPNARQSCIAFPFGGEALPPGDYLVELLVNGETAQALSLAVAEVAADAGPDAGAGADGGADAGERSAPSAPADAAPPATGALVATDRLNGDNCAARAVESFRSDEVIYVAGAGYNGGGGAAARLVDASGALVAEAEAEGGAGAAGCVAFRFAPQPGRLQTGRYTAELLVEGAVVDSVSLRIRE
jgi:hypothetical protein